MKVFQVLFWLPVLALALSWRIGQAQDGIEFEPEELGSLENIDEIVANAATLIASRGWPCDTMTYLEWNEETPVQHDGYDRSWFFVICEIDSDSVPVATYEVFEGDDGNWIAERGGYGEKQFRRTQWSIDDVRFVPESMRDHPDAKGALSRAVEIITAEGLPCNFITFVELWPMTPAYGKTGLGWEVYCDDGQYYVTIHPTGLFSGEWRVQRL